MFSRRLRVTIHRVHHEHCAVLSKPLRFHEPCHACWSEGQIRQSAHWPPRQMALAIVSRSAYTDCGKVHDPTAIAGRQGCWRRDTRGRLKWHRLAFKPAPQWPVHASSSPASLGTPPLKSAASGVNQPRCFVSPALRLYPLHFPPLAVLFVHPWPPVGGHQVLSIQNRTQAEGREGQEHGIGV